MGKVIIDSDFLVACYKRDDASHKNAVSIAEKVHKKYEFMVLNCVVQESTTVISKHMGMDDARQFYQNISHFVDHILSLDDVLEKNAWEIFLKQTKKGCSFIDCANMATIQYYKLDGILSFDTFYPAPIRKGI